MVNPSSGTARFSIFELQGAGFPRWPLYLVLKIFANFGPVISGILEKLSEGPQPNVFTWLTSMEPQEAWAALQEKPKMKGIGKKLASFVLREVAVFCKGWEDQIGLSGKFFQPIDRWVLRCCKAVWKHEKWPDEAPQQETKYIDYAERIARHFPNQIEAMDFNMGAWFVGAKFQEIMAIHGALYCGDSKSLDDRRLELMGSFDADRITRAVCIDPDDAAEKLGRPVVREQATFVAHKRQKPRRQKPHEGLLTNDQRA